MFRRVALAFAALAAAVLVALPSACVAYNYPYECTVCKNAWQTLAGSDNVDEAIGKHCSAEHKYSTDGITNVCVVWDEGKCKRFLHDAIGGGWSGKYPNPHDVPFRVKDPSTLTLIYGKVPGMPPVKAARFDDRWCSKIIRDMRGASNYNEMKRSCSAGAAACCKSLIRKSHADSFCSDPSTGAKPAGMAAAEHEASVSKTMEMTGWQLGSPVVAQNAMRAENKRKALEENKKVQAHVNKIMYGPGDPE